MNKKIYQFFIIFISHRIFWPRMLGQSQAKYVRMIYHLWLEEFLGDPGIRFFYVKIRSLCNPNWLCHIKMLPPFNNSIPPPCPFHGMWDGRMIVVWQCQQKTHFRQLDILFLDIFDVSEAHFQTFSFVPQRLPDSHNKIICVS